MSAPLRALMLGAGFAPPKRLLVNPGTETAVVTWTTLDINPDCEPDIVFDLDNIERDVDAQGIYECQLPVEAETFDEVHAYQVMEHYGQQGDFLGFFAGFRELWRVLKPGGLLIGDVPALHSPWLWGDPGHTRVISAESLSFLVRESYDALGNTSRTDYRSLVAPFWWNPLHVATVDTRFEFVLEKSA